MYFQTVIFIVTILIMGPDIAQQKNKKISSTMVQSNQPFLKIQNLHHTCMKGVRVCASKR